MLFVLYDAGETLALQPVIEKLRAERRPVRALTLGASRGILKDCAYCADLKRDCGGSVAVEAESWKREQRLGAEDLHRAVACFKPSFVISGAVSAVQLQIDSAFRAAGVSVIAYYDALSEVEKDSLTRQFIGQVDELWVPAEAIAKPLREAAKNLTRIEVVGQPTLESWVTSAKSEDAAAIARALFGGPRPPRTVLYAGGSGQGYEAAFRLFARAAGRLGNVRILVSPHPKTDGALERRVLAEFPALQAIFVPAEMGTRRAALVSDVLISRDSSVGVQALFLKKPSIYLDAPGSRYTNFAIARGWASKVSDAAGFEKAMAQALRANGTRAQDIYRAAGIPPDSAEGMAKRIAARRP